MSHVVPATCLRTCYTLSPFLFFDLSIIHHPSFIISKTTTVLKSDSRLGCSNIPQSRKHAKHPINPKPPPQPPFRFRQLTLNVRNEIYYLCLNHEKVAIGAEDYTGWDGETLEEDENLYDEDLVRLVPSRCSSWKPHKPILEPNLLYVDKATYREAATVLYSANEFQFRNLYPWPNLEGFLSRLPKSSRDVLRRLNLDFPNISRFMSGPLVEAMNLPEHVVRVMRTIRRLPMLETLTLRVHDDILSSDLDIIRWISKHQGKSKVLLDIQKALIWDGEGDGKDRLVRISAPAVELFHNCSWEVVGDFEKIDRQHRFGNQGRWLKWLQRNQRNQELPRLRAEEEWDGEW